jgi:hypothetical protein
LKDGKQNRCLTWHIRQLLRLGLAAHHTIGVRRPTRELTAAAGRQDDRTTIKVSRVS